jgi:predicted MPP superfamily phosphohydrolase
MRNSLRMVPAMEAMGYRLLLNECTAIRRDHATIYLAGIDDPHFYRLDDLCRAANAIPAGAVSILLSHTPEPYQRAAHAVFDLMLCGHTHGGQLCLPFGVPVLTYAASPRRFARGAWHHQALTGYTSTGSGTSLVDVRLNCPPEVTLHRLLRQSASRAGGVHFASLPQPEGDRGHRTSPRRREAPRCRGRTFRTSFRRTGEPCDRI